MSDKRELMDKEEMMDGGIATGGTMSKQNTGSWRSQVPLTDFDECIHCMQCWIFCPDCAITVKDGKKTGTDMQHCKGCGICATECPVDCIKMKPVEDVTQEELDAEDSKKE